MQQINHCLERWHTIMAGTLFLIRLNLMYHISFDWCFDKFVLCEWNIEVSCYTRWTVNGNMQYVSAAVASNYLVNNSAVSWWNDCCWTNLQNRESICDAETPAIQQKQKIKRKFFWNDLCNDKNQKTVVRSVSFFFFNWFCFAFIVDERCTFHSFQLSTRSAHDQNE